MFIHLYKHIIPTLYNIITFLLYLPLNLSFLRYRNFFNDVPLKTCSFIKLIKYTISKRNALVVILNIH
jgi:hypothetical protein